VIDLRRDIDLIHRLGSEHRFRFIMNPCGVALDDIENSVEQARLPFSIVIVRQAISHQRLLIVDLRSELDRFNIPPSFAPVPTTTNPTTNSAV
jgi:hypothetical protein